MLPVGPGGDTALGAHTSLSQGQTGLSHIPSQQGTASGLLKPSVQLLGTLG